MDSVFEKSGFAKAFALHRTLIAAHRGTVAGNVTENTVDAFRTAFLSGADIAELDLTRSADGVLYCFHDSTESVNFRQDMDIREMNSRDIDRLMMQNRLGLPSGRGLERFETVLDTFCHGELFNVDRCWPIFPEVFSFLKNRPETVKQLLFKAPLREEYMQDIRTYGKEYMFMPIVYSVEEIEKALTYTDIHIVGFELIANSPEHELYGAEICKKIHNSGRFVWINSLDLSEAPEHILYGGLNDTFSIRMGAENGWGVISGFGVDVIQTDFPALVKNWRDARERRDAE